MGCSGGGAALGGGLPAPGPVPNRSARFLPFVLSALGSLAEPQGRPGALLQGGDLNARCPRLRGGSRPRLEPTLVVLATPGRRGARVCGRYEVDRTADGSGVGRLDPASYLEDRSRDRYQKVP